MTRTSRLLPDLMCNRLRTSGGGGDGRRAGHGFTILELLVVVAILGILALLGAAQFQRAGVRARVVSGKANVRSLRVALEVYCADHAGYPAPRAHVVSDPYGVIGDSALASLTTPIAYAADSVFTDPFGSPSIQGTAGRNMFGFPVQTINPTRSLLYFHYPDFARLIRDPSMNREGYAVVSLAPDQKDSFVAYLPFPNRLPAAAAGYGILESADSLYDPTNGLFSGGDIAGFGGDVPMDGIRGGGDDGR